ncbi:hypothetical protein [Mycolicibacterium porcinum]
MDADDYLAAAQAQLGNVEPTSENLVVLNCLMAIACYFKSIHDRQNGATE